MKHISLTILFSILFSGVQTQGLLDLGVGFIRNSLIDDNRTYTSHVGGYFKTWGVEMNVDMREGPNYVIDSYPEHLGRIQVDINYVHYHRIFELLDVGGYFAINSTANYYDGYMAGIFTRLRINCGRCGVFIRYQYPIYGNEYNIITQQSNKIIFGERQNLNLIPLRDQIHKVAIGISIAIGDKGW